MVIFYNILLSNFKMENSGLGVSCEPEITEHHIDSDDVFLIWFVLFVAIQLNNDLQCD